MAELNEEQKAHLKNVFVSNLKPEAAEKSGLDSCSCSGCSCPGGHGDICDGGTYVGHAGGFYGGASA